MLNTFLILLGKLIGYSIRTLNLGGGSTWPGHIALKLNRNFVEEVIQNSKTRKIVISGTNGKTTTGKLLTTVLKENGKKIAHNAEGANLVNGLASTLILYSNLSGKLNADYLIFESDENAFPFAVDLLQPEYIILLNLFRDQMDRYGEIDTTLRKWKESLAKLQKNSTILLNGDDPSVSHLGNKLKQKILYFGLNEGPQDFPKHGADSIYCPNCYGPLSYKFVTFSHLGDWFCTNCGLKRPPIAKSGSYLSSLVGQYNKYNILAAAILAKELGVPQTQIKNGFLGFKAAFGRQERIKYLDKNLQIFLAKNPTSFNESLSTVKDLKAQNIIIILNDRIPDGLDVSWIWDIDTGLLSNTKNIMLTGDRVFDMALRLRYADFSFDYERDLGRAVSKSLQKTEVNETLYVLPTYSGMLDLRKILKGRKLL